MTVFEFMVQNPFVTLLIVWVVLHFTIGVPLRLINRWIRHRNIVARGWPPAHLDADGDHKEEEQ